MVIMTSVEAQNKFGALLDTVQRETVAITRHGRPAAFVVSPRDMEELQSIRERRSRAAAEFEAWRSRYASEINPEAEMLSEEDVVRLVHELR